MKVSKLSKHVELESRSDLILYFRGIQTSSDTSIHTYTDENGFGKVRTRVDLLNIPQSGGKMSKHLV